MGVSFEDIFARRASVIKAGLERVRQANAILGEPATRVPSVIVGGTNGKGSTSGMLWHLLALHGLKAGLYSSPHLIDFRERYRVVGEVITDEALVETLAQMKRVIERSSAPGLYDELSFFELATLLAYQIFAKCSSEVNVMEVGLGGRLDATNICAPVVSVITSIGMDHTEYLGGTLESIAREKAGIMRDGVPVVFGGLDPSSCSIREVLRSESERHAAPFLEAGVDFGVRRSGSGVTVFGERAGEFSYEEPLPGWLSTRSRYLQENYAVARFACELYLRATKRAAYPLTEESETHVMPFSAGTLRPATLTGRFDIRTVDLSRVLPVSGPERSINKEIIFDVCHNVEGVEAFIRSLRAWGAEYGRDERFPLLVTVLRDKDFIGMLERLEDIADEIIIYQNESERSIRPEDFERFMAHKTWRPRILFAPNISVAMVEAARTPGFMERDEWLLCGSVYGIGSALRFFGLGVAEVF